MHRVLEVKRNDLLSKADTQMRDQEQLIRQEIQDHHRSMMYASVVSFAEETMKETDPAYFLQTVPMIESKVNEAIEHLEKLGNISVDNFPALHLELAETKKKMEAINFVKVPKRPIIEGQFDDEINSRPIISWESGSAGDVTERYEVRYTSHYDDVSASSSRQSEVTSYDSSKTIFELPKDAEGTLYDVTIRSVNKAGASEWSEPVLMHRTSAKVTKFKLVSDDCDVTIESEGRRAHVRTSTRDQVHVLKGDSPFWSGEHYWEVMVTSTGARHVVVGVNELSPTSGVSLHGTIHFKDDEGANGALLHVACASATLLNQPCFGGSWANLFGKLENDITRSSSIGQHHLAAGIELWITGGNEATVHFYDVTGSSDRKFLFRKCFRFTPPLWPVVAVDGNAKVLVK
uniref:Fibronectin type-III domain-containing protein n=1 Tax=Ciona savignyi TaxID=51511 RepID=H2ZLC5_CIOSA